MSDPRFATLACAAPRLTVVALRGATSSPVPAGGYGGWNEIQRPRRKSLTEWDGISPLRVLLPLVLGVRPSGDCYATDTSAGPDRDALERMAQPPSVGSEPPLIRVAAAMPHNNVDWVIEDFDWDPNPMYSAKGFLVRQAVTVHLLEYVRGDRINGQTAAAATRAAAQAKAATAAKAGGTGTHTAGKKTYIVRAGDTLSAIAARELGNYKRWPEIATLNGIRDPKNLKVGQKLRLP